MSIGTQTSEETIVLRKRRRLNSHIPFGFDLDPNDSGILVPNIEHYRVLHTIRQMRKAGSTYRECQEYVKAHTGRDYSRMDISRLIKRIY